AAHSAGRRAFAELYAGFFWALLALSGAGSLAVLLVLRLWPALLGPELAPYGRATALAVLAIPGMVLVTLCGNAIAAAQRARTSGGYGLLNTAALAVLPTLGVVAGGVTGYYAGALLAVAAVAACGVLYLARSEGVLVGPPQLGVATLRRCRGLGTFAASLYIMALALPATHLLARYTILRTSGLEAAGLLQSAMAGGLAFALVMRQSNALFLTPAMNRHTPAEQKFREAAEYLRSFSLVAGLVALPLVLFPEVALYVLYSRRFLSAAPYAYLFVVAQLLEVIGGVLLGILIGLDRIVAQLAITLTGITALAVLAVTLGPRFGLAGIGVAFLADGVLVLAVSAWLLQRQYGFNLLADCGGIPLGVLA